MVTYCAVVDVQGFLQLPDAFSGSTNPTATQVGERIEEAEDEINSDTQHSWKEVTVVNEYRDTDLHYNFSTGIPVYLRNRAIKTLDDNEGDKLEVWNGSEWEEWISDANKTEGRDQDYWLRYEDGILYIRGRYRRPVRIRVTYRFGEATVPKDIQKAAILLTAIDLVESDDRSVLTPDVGSSQVGYESKTMSWRRRYNKIVSKHKEFKLANL